MGKLKGIGFLSGALLGGGIGGPIGAIVGGFTGAVLGKSAEMSVKPAEIDNQRRHLKLDEVAAAMRTSNGRCNICGSTVNLSIDHIIPLTRGGTNNSYNLRVLCKEHNSIKNNRLDSEYYPDY